jgi:hypothetical protein
MFEEKRGTFDDHVPQNSTLMWSGLKGRYISARGIALEKDI